MQRLLVEADAAMYFDKLQRRQVRASEFAA
jgi:hypothetical protein